AGVITRDDIRSTYDTIRPFIRRTPVVELDPADLDPAISDLPGVTLKLEQLQCAGSFKARGAFAKLLVTGDRYADALAAAQAWVHSSGAMSVHAFDQRETLLGQGTLGLELAG